MEYLESICARYQGEAKIVRLHWIARQTTDHDVSNAAYGLLTQHFRTAGNPMRYKKIFLALNNSSDDSAGSSGGNITSDSIPLTSPENSPQPLLDSVLPDYSNVNQFSISPDTAWLNNQEARNLQVRDVLNSRLGQAQAHLNKDAIRTAYLALADHEIHSADLKEAFYLLHRARDYCVTQSQTNAVSLQILEVAIALQNYAAVREYVIKLEHAICSSKASHSPAVATVTMQGTSASHSATINAAVAQQQQQDQHQQHPPLSSPATQSVPDVTHCVKIASALAAIHHSEFEKAAALFLEITTGRFASSSSTIASTSPQYPICGSTASWSTVLCGEEIALYTGILALCVLSRDDMVLLSEHAEALALAPHMKECLSRFHRGNYQAAWNGMKWDELRLDNILGPRLDQLKNLMVKRAIFAYWHPYLEVKLHDMAADLEGLVPNADYLLKHMVDVLEHSHSEAGRISHNYSEGRGEENMSAATKCFLLDTRIDLPNQVLVRELVDTEIAAEKAANNKLSSLSNRVLDDSYSILIRMACISHGLVVKDPDVSIHHPDQVENMNYYNRGGERLGRTTRRLSGGSRSQRGFFMPGGTRTIQRRECHFRTDCFRQGGSAEGDDVISDDEDDMNYRRDIEEDDMVVAFDDMNPEDLY